MNGAALKKRRSSVDTLSSPVGPGCVPSASKSSGCHVRPSRRGVAPFAHRSGPQPIHGATSGDRSPAIGSIAPVARWRSCASIAHFTAKPVSYAYGSGLSVVVAKPA